MAAPTSDDRSLTSDGRRVRHRCDAMPEGLHDWVNLFSPRRLGTARRWAATLEQVAAGLKRRWRSITR